MTTPQNTPPNDPNYSQPNPMYQQPAPMAGFEPPKAKNKLGIAALACSIAGSALVCIPEFMGFLFLNVAFVLSIVALAQKGKTKSAAIAALVISIVVNIVSFIVISLAIFNAVNTALNSEVMVSAEVPEIGAAQPAEEAVEEGLSKVASDEGTRENPLPIGTIVSGATGM